MFEVREDNGLVALIIYAENTPDVMIISNGKTEFITEDRARDIVTARFPDTLHVGKDLAEAVRIYDASF